MHAMPSRRSFGKELKFDRLKMIGKGLNLLGNNVSNSCTTNTHTKDEDKYWVQNDVCCISYHCVQPSKVKMMQGYIAYKGRRHVFFDNSGVRARLCAPRLILVKMTSLAIWFLSNQLIKSTHSGAQALANMKYPVTS